MARMVYKIPDVRRMCETKLSMKFRTEGESNAWLIEGGRKLARVTLPHHREELKRGTLGSVIRQLGADRQLFQGLMNCPSGRADLVARLLAEEG